DPEELRGEGLVSVRVLQRFSDRPVLDFGERGSDRECEGSAARRGGIRDGIRQIAEPERVRSAQHGRAFDHVLELAHVAGPGVVGELLQHLGTDPESRAPVLPAVEAEEVIHEQRDVLAPSTERRRLDRDHVETVIKILAKAPRLDLGEQIAVGRSHDTGVALLDPPTDRLILALLQYPQNFDLYLRTQLADLVEE